jgi:hypothetical protein
VGTILPSETSLEETTSSRLLRISPVPKIPRKYSIEKIGTPVLLLKKLIIPRKSEGCKEIKSKSREIGSVNSPNT